MTADLRKLLGAAKVAVAAHQAYPDGKSSLERARCEMALLTAAVNALPALLTVCEAAQRWADARKAHVRYLMAYDDVGHREKDTTAEEINLAATALTAALAQWEKTQ